jgi:hypothetical protein
MDTMSNSSLRITIVVIGLLFCWTLVLFGKKSNEVNKQEIVISDLKKKIDTLLHEKDSIYWELFPVQNELGRYEIAYEIFLERNPKAAKQYGTIILKETE